ncbi:MAG: hypothetical protein EBZ77_14660, partial [Chitinophagia bacterium]|nr:hypothetical protein [Chitinophagia bacterium]
MGRTADTNFSFSNMSLTEKSYVCVQPVLDGIPGYRSKCAIVVANSGDCSTTNSTGDLMLEALVSPRAGRLATQTALTSTATIRLKARNLYLNPAGNYNLSLRINGGAWTTIPTPIVLPANDTAIISLPGIDLHDTIDYQIVAAIHNTALADPNSGNDTLRFTIKQVSNTPISLPFADGFEQADSLTVLRDTLALTPDHHWDFNHSVVVGRLRTVANDEITITGRRSISLDDQLVNPGSLNVFTGTFNLSSYDTSTDEVRLDFDYVLHGLPQTSAGNDVLARVSDATGWTTLYTYDLNAYPGNLNRGKALSLTDIARQARQNFGTSFQVAFRQQDTSLIAARNYGNGVTIDNVRLYTVANDASLEGIVSPLAYNCGINASQPIVVAVRNGVNHTLYNVQVAYRFDSGAVVQATIDSIKPKTTINYTFTTPINLPSGSTHFVDAWVSAAGDSYLPNDTINHYIIRNNAIYTVSNLVFDDFYKTID